MSGSPITPLFPYTTLFRSEGGDGQAEQCGEPDHERSTQTSSRAGARCSTRRDHRTARRTVPGRTQISSPRSEEHTSELQSRQYLVCRLLLEKKNSLQKYRF